MAVTDGHLLGGRVRYSQPAEGFRSGLEPVLLAATVPARPHHHVLEAGTGAGAALLCLSARVPGLSATGVEIDAATARLAQANAAANGFERIRILNEAIERAALTGPFDHAIANPPYHAGSGPVSPVPARDTAKRGSAALLEAWIGRLSAALRAKGSLTLIVASAMLPACLGSMERHACPCAAIYPLWPKPDRAAKLVILRGTKLGRSPLRLMSGLVLHRPDGSFTDAAQAVLRDGAALPIGSDHPPEARPHRDGAGV